MQIVVLIVLSIVLSIKKLNRCSVLTWIKLGPVPNRMIALGFFLVVCLFCFVLFPNSVLFNSIFSEFFALQFLHILSESALSCGGCVKFRKFNKNPI